MESLLRVGDDLTSVGDTERPFLLPIDNELRIIWVLRGLIESTRDPSQRVAALTGAYEQGTAYVTMLHLGRTLGAQHGLYGSNTERGEIALVDKDTCLSLANTAIARVKDAARKDMLSSVANPLKLAHRWMAMGDKDEAITWLRSACAADDKFPAVVREAVSESHSWGMGGLGSMGDRVARTSLRMSVEYLCSFFDPLTLRDRAKALLENADVIKTLDTETIFGLEHLRDRIRDDGSVIPEDDGDEED